ncbi:UNVERIFIED_CONTAM: hypothetical protein Scaly_2548800 [Sesamum calycinum]|uniref:Uncharacterized protein n=1 Tax=Sesamum calycinum TaxID=2727403 RepID=A0AAW2J1R0_9LAMI
MLKYEVLPVDVGPSSYGGDPYDYDEPRRMVIILSKYDRISQWANRILPPNRTLPGEYYNTKKLVNDLSLSVEKIDACKNDCMLHWKDDVDLEYYKFCGDARATVDHMTWHVTHQTEEGSMCHPFDIEGQENNIEESALSSQASAAPNEQQLWMLAAGGRIKGQVFGLGSEARHTIAGPSQPSSSNSPTPSPPQPESGDLRDRVQMIEHYIRSRDPDWPDCIVTQPPTDTPAPNDDDEHTIADCHDLDYDFFF